MIRTTGFKRAFLMPSNRRPRDSSLNDFVRGYTIRSDGVISCYPCRQYFSHSISERYFRSRFGRPRLRIPFITGS